MSIAAGWFAGEGSETDIRFLDLTELEQLAGAPYPSDAWGSTEPTLYLTAPMTGMRQGGLLALPWRDVDFEAKRIRVVKNYVRGQLDTPKARKSALSVPMASRADQALLELRDRDGHAYDCTLTAGSWPGFRGNTVSRSELTTLQLISCVIVGYLGVWHSRPRSLTSWQT